MSPYRLAVLLCDTPMPSVLAEEGDYTRIFTHMMEQSKPAATDFTMDPFDVRNKLEYPPADANYDGIFLTGSAASAYEDVEWINRLVKYVADLVSDKPKAKIFGICFGHQIIARALGGECIPNPEGWEVGLTQIDLTPEFGQSIFGQEKLNIQQMHRDHVPNVPSEIYPLGSTEVAANQGMVKFVSEPSKNPKDISILTVQGHPEFTKEILRKIVDVRASSGVITQDLAVDAIRRNEWRNDGVDVIAKVFWQVLGAE